MWMGGRKLWNMWIRRMYHGTGCGKITGTYWSTLPDRIFWWGRSFYRKWSNDIIKVSLIWPFPQGVHSRNVPSISNPRIASCLPVCKFSRFIVLYPFISPVYSIGITFPKSDFHTGISNLFFHTDAGHIVISVCFLLRIICAIVSSIPYCQKNST